jgi:maleylpyruvate isomerase
MSAIEDFQDELTASTQRLLATAAGLSDADVPAPSLLPGWTRGHVLAHVARTADALLNLLTWARTGVYTPQYPNPETRAAEIEAGAGRPAAEQLADLRDGAERMERAIETMPPQAWTTMVSGMRPPEHPAWYVLMRRLREVEVHHADLGAGYGWRDWTDSYVSWELHDTMLAWPYGQGPVSEIVAGEPHGDGHHVQVWSGLGDGPAVHGTPREILAWLTGRSTGEDLLVRPYGEEGGARIAPACPVPPPWLTQPAPAGLPAEPPLSWPPLPD